MGCSGSESALSANNLVNEQIREFLQRLDYEASKYVNSKVDEDKSLKWHPSPAKVQLISAAWKCARGTYNLEGTITNTSYCTFRREKALWESFAGTVKAITPTVVETTSDDIEKSDMLSGLILAIRGSASEMDHIANANSRPQPTGGFITFDKVKGQKPHIIFTGHSAGGAVLQILYLKYISNQAFNESARFSCATFGAPLCVTAPVDLSFYHPGGKTLCLNIINEFDVITRADKPYILSLVDIARNTLNQPPKALLPEPETSTVHGKRIYEKRVEALEEGHFNNRTGWQQEDDED
ncbi:alpha beta-hydrolase [Fusarium langsethiae]|uniref:Alpha beta-hydrolase n=1 Tax=Fusarium langsethiae TaxID=179993 RepID=A0A0N0DEI9_FUSLA|nr:alpha beta-hydrolase [Fusarium langsethiae]GKU02797.1 unnamed protein product [Fusarium langsethiae]GKU17642.1 unnamed protein product [Fusarium langsethiae]